MKNKLNQLLEDCTVGLAGDQELRLDIQSELKNHIEERIEEEKQEGADEERSLENALKAFGEVPDIADGIMAANKKRLNLRGKIRLAVMYLIIPLSIIAALASLNELLLIPKQLKSLGMLQGDPSSVAQIMRVSMMDNLFFNFFTKEKYSEKEKLILYGAPGETDPIKKQKAIWDKFPDNKIYMGNYITSIMSKGLNYPMGSEKGKEYIRELRKAEKLDPENARYNYALAAYYCNAGVELKFYPNRGKGYFYEIKNRDFLDKGMAELKKGLKKPYYKTYSKEMLQKRLKILGPSKTLLQNIEQISIAASILLPDLSQFRNFARLAPKYAEILIGENKKKKALPFLEVWKKLGTQVNNDSCFLIELLVAVAVFETNKEIIPELYEKAGYPEMAEQYKIEQALLAEPVVKWKERKKDHYTNWKQSAGIMAAMLLPELGEKISLDELTPGRILDYIIMEKFLLSAICFFMLFVMLICLIIVLRWHFAKNSKRQSILLLPDFTKTANLFLYSVIVPVIAYYILSRLPVTGGREFNVITNVGKWSIQIGCLFLALLIIPMEMTVFYVRKRFKELNIPAPETATPIKSKVFKILCVALLVMAILPGTLGGVSDLMSVIGWALLAGTTLLIMVNLFFRFWRCIFAEKQYSRYYSSVAKTLIPIFAGIIILLIALSKPYVSTQETYLIQNDPLMTIEGDNVGFTNIENRLVKRLKKEIQKQEEKIEKNKGHRPSAGPHSLEIK